ncbi:4Fe-4S binding protein [Desulfarculus baarsii]
MADDIFRRLQQRLDTYSLGFPQTDSGVELEILRHLFSEDDAEVFLAMSPKVEPAEVIAPRLGREVAAMAVKLAGMAERGLLFSLRKGDQTLYGAIPVIHGLFEFQVKRIGPELAGLMERYFAEAQFTQAMQTSLGAFLRTIPVQKAVPVAHNVASFDDACQLLRAAKLIVVTECICRKQQITVGKGCGKPLEACFMFGSMAQYYLDHDMGRRVDVDEAIALVTKAQEAGLVTQPGTAQNPAGMCNCCGDCCGVLRALNLHPKPAEIVFSNHFAVVDKDACTGCETCLDRCQMKAIVMGDDGLARIDLDRCIGCGLCVTTCPTEALTLQAKPSAQLAVPPRTSADQMMFMAQKRGLI